PDFLVSHPKAHIRRFIHIRLDPQKRAVERLRLSEVADGIDDDSDPLIHKKNSFYYSLNIPVSIETLPPTRRFHGEAVSLSHRVGFARHCYDETKRGNVTDGRTRPAGGAIPGRTFPVMLLETSGREIGPRWEQYLGLLARNRGMGVQSASPKKSKA